MLSIADPSLKIKEETVETTIDKFLKLTPENQAIVCKAVGELIEKLGASDPRQEKGDCLHEDRLQNDKP